MSIRIVPTRILSMVTLGILFAGFAATLPLRIVAAGEQGVSVTVMGESWDADSRGFAYIAGLSKKEGEQTSARRGSRISVDGRPDKFAFSGPGPGFELTFTTTEPTFRLIVEGDRFPRVITRSYCAAGPRNRVWRGGRRVGVHWGREASGSA